MICVKDKEYGAFDEADWAIADNSQAYVDEAISNIKFGGDNLLRNSGFTGDYETRYLEDDSYLSANNELYSSPFDHWVATDVLVQDSDLSMSGKQVFSERGKLSQILAYKVFANEEYVVSFSAKGTSARFTIGGTIKEVTFADEYARYEIPIIPLATNNSFMVQFGGYIYDLKFEKGNRATAWSPSLLDNPKEKAYYLSIEYLKEALDGATDVNGGLVLTEQIQLGDYDKTSKEWVKINGGVSGIYNSDNDVAFWAGGNLEKAITAVSKYENDPTYQPTEEELSSMANFVVTHGGRAILNEAIVRGTVYASAGSFGGTVQMNFKQLAMGTTHVFSLSDSSSIWIPNNAGGLSNTTLQLNDDDAFDGILLNVFCYPMTSKNDGPARVTGRILVPQKTEGIHRYYASEIGFPMGGFAQFTYSKFTHEWILINIQSAYEGFVEYE